MYKLIACDLDETLLGDDSKVPTINIDAIKKADELGIKFVPATGRGHRTITQILHELMLEDKENEYIISFNGGAIVENKGYKMLRFHGLEFDLAKKLFEVGIKNNLCVHVYTEKDVFVFNINEGEKEYINNRLVGYVDKEEKSIEFLKGIKISKILFQHLDKKYLNTIENKIKPITEGKVTVTYSSNRYIEFNSIGVNKGQAVIELGEILGIKREEIIAIGDNFNDLSMLESAGLSVAVNNAVPEIKKIVNYVCEADNNEGAVAEVINKFILNNK